MTKKKTILSGIQPSGRLHIGNYFGAMKQHIAMQEEGDAFYFLANYHSLTSIQDKEKLENNTRDVVWITWLSGLIRKSARCLLNLMFRKPLNWRGY